MTDVFTDDSARVKRRKVTHTHGRIRVESRCGVKNDGAFIRIFFCGGKLFLIRPELLDVFQLFPVGTTILLQLPCSLCQCRPIHLLVLLRYLRGRRIRIPQRHLQDFNELPLEHTILENQRLNLDALAARKDIRNWYRANIRHGHRLVEHVQLLIQLQRQVAVLNAICRHLGTVRVAPTMELENLGWTHVVLHDRPLHRLATNRRQILVG